MKISKITLLVLLILVIIAEVASAVSTTKQEAEKAVRGWLKFDTQPLKMKLGQQIKETEIFSDANDQPIYYVVYLQPSGFVIVPADDLIEPIIAFADDGAFVSSLNNPLGALVNQDINGRIRAARSLSIPQPSGNKTITLEMESAALEKAASANQGKWEHFISISEMVENGPMEMGLPSISDVRVTPLVQTRWNQGSVCGAPCYNYYTPNHYPCGCVATAMAQYMRFQEYAVGPYNWNNMVLIPDCSITTPERQAIGELCYDAGVSVNMNYGSGGSSTDTLKTKDALTSTFGYSNAIKGWNSGSNIGGSLIAMVNPNLDYGNPVILGITGTSGGHAIVTDGYGYNSSTLYHHLNMGWSGSDDAWYNLPDIDSSPSFNSVYKCVYNIFINGTGEIISGRVVDTSGNPINGAMVTATRSGGGTYNTTTNSNGIYAFGKIPANSSYTVSVSKDGLSFTIQNANTGLSSDYSSASGNTHGVNFIGSGSGGNNDPFLYNAWVNPQSGSVIDDYEYTVTYHDVDGDPPANIWVWIDGNWNNMSLKSGTPASGTYHFVMPGLSAGEHHYYYEASDVRGGSAVTRTYTGPWVDTPPPGSFEVLDFEIDDSTSISVNNDNDGLFESGEDVYIRPRIRYSGIGTASHVVGTALYSGPGLEVPSIYRQYPDFYPGDSAYPLNDGFFRISADKDFMGSVGVDFEVTWDENLGSQIIASGLQLDVQPTAYINVDPREWDFGVSGTAQDVKKTVTIYNVGTETMQVTGMVPSHGDTTWTGGAFPWVIPSGGAKIIEVTIETSGLQGLIEPHEVVVISDARIADYTPLSDRIVITGLVSDLPPAYKVPGTTGGSRHPDSYGNMIVWSDAGDIHGYDIALTSQYTFCPDPCGQTGSRVSSGLVAWHQFSGWDITTGLPFYDIYTYNLGNGQKFAVSTTSADEWLVGVDSNLVAFVRADFTWSSYGEQYPGYNVYYYDVDTEAETQVTFYSANRGSQLTVASIKGDFADGVITWSGGRHDWLGGGNDWNNAYQPVIFEFEIGKDASPVLVDETGGDYRIRSDPSTSSGRVAWARETRTSSPYYDQVWTWKEGVYTQETVEETDHDDPAIGVGDELIVYEKDSALGLFYWDHLAGSEGQASNQSYYKRWRMNDHMLVWEGGVGSRDGIYYTFLNQADISVTSADIVFSDTQPYEGDIIDVNVTVHNLNPWDTTENITVRLYDYDPDNGGIQLGSDEIISGGIVAQSSAIVEFNDIPVGIEGTKDIYTKVFVPSGDNPANNKAYRTLEAKDSDTQGPVIFNDKVQEFNGNGDGKIEEDEQILISWEANDISDINSSSCTIDANDYVALGTYFVIVGPYAVGNYNFTICATDGDISPETSEYSGSFRVEPAGPACWGYLSQCHGDSDNSGDVKSSDFLALKASWFKCYGDDGYDPCADFDRDGCVKGSDFLILKGNWYQAVEPNCPQGGTWPPQP